MINKKSNLIKTLHTGHQLENNNAAYSSKYEQLYQETLKELEDYKGSRLKYKRLYTETLKELEDYKGSRLKYKRLYKETLKELEDYKGSRLKYKRLASNYEYKYNKIVNSRCWRIKDFIKKIILFPLKNFKKFFSIKSTQKNIPSIKQETDTQESVISRENVFSCKKIETIYKGKTTLPTTFIYADLNLNIVDGSSIWLSSVVNLFNSFSNVVILSKYNVKTDLITSNFRKTSFSCVLIEPKDLGKTHDSLKNEEVIETLLYLDELIPSVQNLLVRGLEIIEKIVKNNHFKGRLIPYITNFYTQKNGKAELLREKVFTFSLIAHQTKIWLWQTKEMKEIIEKNIQLSNKNHILFPPILDIGIFENMNKNKLKENSSQIIIGYAGKIQPDWGVLELIDEVEKLNNEGFNIKLRIISSKISWRSTIKSGEGFVEKVKESLKKDFIEYIQNVNRKQAISLLNDVDYIWSYRDAAFEESTLELSTKLLEGIALGKPVISYPSSIHKNVCGDDYPYFINKPNELKNLLMNKIDLYYLNTLANTIKSKYSLEERIKEVKNLVKPIVDKKIVIASNDYKFIDHYYSFLKNSGYLVYKDFWEWGKEDNLKRSELLYQKSDIIFCEWGLANSVWYSQRNTDNKPMFIRVHAQEVRQKAMKFGRQIDYNNINKIIYVSDRIRDKSIDLFKIDKHKTTLIPNYVLTDDFKPMNRKRTVGLNFGIVGITPQSKRLDRALDLMEKILVKHSDAKLFIKGHRPENYEWMHAPGRVKELDYYYEQYKRIDENIKLKNAVIFDDFGNDMPEWYQKIDFILSPSDHESFHYALADGIASGCIPIVWDWTEADKLYSDDFIIKDINEGIDKIEMAIKDINIAQKIENNRNIIVNKYSYKKIYNELLFTLNLK